MATNSNGGLNRDYSVDNPLVSRKAMDSVYATGATVVVAASDSASRGAQYRCTGIDDQLVINTAIASLPVNGGRVLLLAGTFAISASVIIARSNVALEGEGFGFWDGFVPGGTSTAKATSAEGAGMTKIKATSANFNLIKIDNTPAEPNGVDNRRKSVAIRNLYLYGASQAASGKAGIYCVDLNRPTDQLIIESVFVHNTYDGMDITADAPHITKNTVMDCGNRGIVLGTTTGGIYGYIADNVIADIGGDGIVVTINCQGSMIVNNTVVRCEVGINNAADETNVSDNQLNLNRSVGIFTSGRAIIKGNRITSGLGYGIWAFNGTGGSIITNNYAADMKVKSCIRIQGHNDSVVANNVVLATDLANNGLEILSSLATIVSNNRVRLFSGTGTGTSTGLLVDAASTPGVYTGNLVSGNWTAKSSIPAASAVVINANNLTV